MRIGAVAKGDERAGADPDVPTDVGEIRRGWGREGEDPEEDGEVEGQVDEAQDGGSVRDGAGDEDIQTLNVERWMSGYKELVGVLVLSVNNAVESQDPRCLAESVFAASGAAFRCHCGTVDVTTRVRKACISEELNVVDLERDSHSLR